MKRKSIVRFVRRTFPEVVGRLGMVKEDDVETYQDT